MLASSPFSQFILYRAMFPRFLSSAALDQSSIEPCSIWPFSEHEVLTAHNDQRGELLVVRKGHYRLGFSQGAVSVPDLSQALSRAPCRGGPPLEGSFAYPAGKAPPIKPSVISPSTKSNGDRRSRSPRRTPRRGRSRRPSPSGPSRRGGGRGPSSASPRTGRLR